LVSRLFHNKDPHFLRPQIHRESGRPARHSGPGGEIDDGSHFRQRHVAASAATAEKMLVSRHAMNDLGTMRLLGDLTFT
jgi:hypothetical protein